MLIEIGSIIFITYAIVARVLFGKFKSYSQTWYKMKTYLYSRGTVEVYFRWFQLWIFSLSIISYFMVYQIAGGLFAFISSLLLSGVGFIPNANNKEYSKYHVLCAVSYFIVTMIGLSALVDYGWYIFALWGISSIILRLFVFRYILFIELVSFIAIITLCFMSGKVPSLIGGILF